jgi:hypothetical protein
MPSGEQPSDCQRALGEPELYSQKAPIRVALLVDSFIQPQWVYKIIGDIQLSSIAQVVLILKKDNVDVKQKKLTSRTLGNINYILYLIYTALDNFLSRVNHDAFVNMDIEKLISGCPIMHLRTLRRGDFDSFREEDIIAVHEYALDVVLRFGFQKIRGDIVNIAKYGVWSYCDECGQVGNRVPSGFWEVMRGEPVTEATLRILEDLGNGKVICRSYVATNRCSVKRNRNGLFWESSLFVLRKLNEIYVNGSLQLDAESLNYSENIPNILSREYPTYFKLFLCLLKICKKYFLYKVQKLFYYDQWFLAYKIKDRETYIGNTPYQFKTLIPPHGSFWADPFPVKSSNKYFIFMEEYIYKNKKGHIAVIEMDKKGKYKRSIKVLEKGYHLSYPFVFRWCGGYYMIPETVQSRSIELYRCTAFPLNWKLEKILMSNIKAVDTTLAEINGLWWMFVNIGIDGTSNDVELHLFYANTPLGPWNSHKHNPVKSDVRSARSAGRIIFWQGEMYRPSQDCSEGYGYAVSMNKIIRIDPERYIETEVSKILPQWTRNVIANHTLNSCDNLIVIDGMMKTFKFTIPGMSKLNNIS